MLGISVVNKEYILVEASNDMSMDARECISQNDLCDEHLVGLWEAHTKVLPHNYYVFNRLQNRC